MNSRRTPAVMIAILVLGIALSLLAGLAVRRHEAVFLKADFAALIDARLRTIGAGFQQNVELLHALRSLRGSQGQFDAKTFARVTGSSIVRHPELTALEWAPRVTRGERAMFEASISSRYPAFEIIERDGESGTRRAVERDSYYPVLYIEPMSGNEFAQGLDLTSDAMRRTAIEAAIECGEPRASGLINLVQNPQGGPGFLVTMPIYDDGAALPAGVIVGVYRARDVAAMAGTPASGVSLRFSDVEPHGEPLSFTLGEPVEAAEITVERQLSLAGRSWRIVGEATHEYVSQRRSRESLFVTGLGLLLTLVTAFWFRMSSLRSRAVARLVESRTEELTRVNEDLDRQRGILQSILDNLGDGVAVADRDGNLTMFNPKAEEILGFGPVQAGSERWSEIYGLFNAETKEPVPSEELPLSKAVRGEESRNQELLVRNPRRPGGAIILVTATPLVDGKGQVQGGVAVFRDVSERKWAEAVLRDSESRFRTIVESTANVLIILSRQLRIREFNPQAERIFGISRGAALGQDFLEVCVTPERRARVTEGLHRALEGEATASFVASIRTVSGEERTLLWSFGRFESAESHDSAVIVSGVDVTERRQAERARRIQELAAHLQSAREEERSHLARELHDELGQSLTGLKLEVSYIGRRAADDEPTLERLRGVVKMIDECIASVRRISSDLRPQMLDELGMTEAIRWQVNEFERRTGVPCAIEFPERRIGWEKEKDTAMFRILQEALTNIARHAEATRAWVKVALEGDGVLLEVGDDGRGFSRDSVADGSSFGLIGMEERARICGGSIRFVPAGDSGTIVSVRFPWRPPAGDQSDE